ncbi:MAG: hypothetical protein E7588_01730 [Ruminococcaceae bacterium]|nr:hypothetical protein [Oscillospiraceae bacterium]
MMKLILSSCDFHNEFSRKCIIDNLDKKIDSIRILFIPNERASKKAIRSEKYYLRLQEFGFLHENIYIFDYYAPENFYGLDIDVIYISGGNTFQTFDRIKKRGFDTEIVRYVKNGVTYIGGSAGAHIASLNIEHVLKYDCNTAQMNDFTALGLFSGIFVCHYTEERSLHYAELKARGEYAVYALSNDDSVVVIDDKVEMFGNNKHGM